MPIFYTFFILPQHNLYFFLARGVFSKGMIKWWQESLKERHSIQFFTPMSAFSACNTRKSSSFCRFRGGIELICVNYLTTDWINICKSSWKDQTRRCSSVLGWKRLKQDGRGIKCRQSSDDLQNSPNSCKITILVEIGFAKHLSWGFCLALFNF